MRIGARSRSCADDESGSRAIRDVSVVSRKGAKTAVRQRLIARDIVT